MSTNFYFRDRGRHYTTSKLFIGKRAAAGLYCWRCCITLCKDGPEQVHFSSNWHKACPKCGDIYQRGAIHDDGDAVGIELGFAKPRFSLPVNGVMGCSSFLWHIPKDNVEEKIRSGHEPIVRDEYGRDMDGDSFLLMIKCNCPIQRTNIDDDWS